MELGIWERMKLLQILPQQGNFVTLKIVRKLREDLSFTEEEIAEVQFRQDGDRVMWNPNVSLVREFQFGPKATEIIIEGMKRLDQGKTLDPQTLILFERFVDTTEYDLGGEAG